MPVTAAEPIENVESELVSDIIEFTDDPLGFVNYAYPWGRKNSDLEESTGPREWQTKVLKKIGDHLSNPKTRFQPLRIAVASGHGIGKSAEVAMIMGWGMSTCEDCKIVITANTDTQLKTKTWPEVNKWFRMMICGHWFNVYKESITIKNDKLEATWRADRVSWSTENTEAFQGLHNMGKRIIVIFDEASSIDDRIYEVTEGALTDENTEIIFIAFGNPTKNTGAFKEAIEGKQSHRWYHLQVDSRDVDGTNKVEIAKWIEDYGEDSDFVRIRVRGEFPRASLNQFIASDDVARCRKYKAMGFEDFPKILSCDVARFGDDRTVIMARQGRQIALLGQYRGLSTAQVTDLIVDFSETHYVDAIVVDSDGIGAPVHDQLVARGYRKKLHEFHGGHPAYNSKMYFNRRAEVWGLLRDALIAGVQIPDLPEMETDLTAPLYGFSNQQQVQLEKKDDMKKRGMSSPDLGDSAAMTFAVRLATRRQNKPPKKEFWEVESQGQNWMA